MRRLVSLLIFIALIGFAIFWWLTKPSATQYSSSNAQIDLDAVDLDNGEKIFWASGCASCHAEKNATEENKLLLGGGHRLDTPFGTFITPNISPDSDTGIGSWNFQQFLIAMKDGVSPEGKHYYPAFPYTSYVKMTEKDVVDLFGYLKTLPPVSRINEPHELSFVFGWRRPLGIWKNLFLNPDWVFSVPSSDEQLTRGQYLVEALGHCGECHTPRNLIGGLKSGKWLGGGPAPEGLGKIPNITPHPDGIAGWSSDDIAYYLESGFTPDYDSVGGTMVSVQENMSKLPSSDLEAISAYLKAIPPVDAN